MERALEICTDRLGENHPDTVSTRNNLEYVREKVRAKLGGRVRKPRAPHVARRPDTTLKLFRPRCRCEDEIEAPAANA